MEIVKIKTIKKLDKVYDRYDLTINTTNNFFANGILIHNTSFISGKVKIKKPRHLSNFEKFINKCCRKLKMEIKYPEYDYAYENIYSSRGVIKNQYINENPGQGYYKFDVYTKYGKMLDPYIPQGVTVYGEIAGYLGNGEEIAQKKFDYGCEVGQGFLMPYRITSTNEDGTKREWDMEEVDNWTNALIQWAQANGDTELATSLRPTFRLYHGKLTDLYPEISTTEHWQENVLEAMKNDVEHFGMEQMEPLCTHFEVPREGICIRIDGDPETECFKLKTDAFRFFEKKCYDKGEVDREVEENESYEVEEV